LSDWAAWKRLSRKRSPAIKFASSNDQNAIKSTKIEIGKAQIVFSDDKGVLRVEKVGSKKILIAKDPQGMLLFSGPVETQQDLDKVPVHVGQRYEKLQQNDLLAVISPGDADEQNDSIETEDEGDDAIELAEQAAKPPAGVFLALVKRSAL
jgi:hypothetical protein